MDIVSDSDKWLYKNDSCFESNQKEEEDPLNNKENFNVDQNVINGKAQENQTKQLDNSYEPHQKESTQNTTEHFESSTKFRTELIINEREKEIYSTIKRLKKLLDECKDIGRRINQILNRIKANNLGIVQKVAFEMVKKTEYYKKTKKNLTKIDNSFYKFENSSANLVLLKKRFKEVLCEQKENEQIIRIIMNDSDYPSLIKFLNMTIEKLISLCSDEKDSTELEEDYLVYIKTAYKKLKAKMIKEGKSDIYIQSFNYFAGHIEYVYNSINEHRKNKSKMSNI